MSRKYKINDQEKIYFLTFAVVRWVDVFTRRDYKDIVIESLKYCQLHKGLELYAFCIMPNHVHLIASAKEGCNLSAIMRDFKKFTSTKIIQAISTNIQESRQKWMLWLFKDEGMDNPNNRNYQFWQQENHPIELSDNKMLEQRLHYLHQNPVRARICYSATEYVYSSASQYAGLDAILPVALVE